MANANSGAGEPNDMQQQFDQLRDQVGVLMTEHEAQAARGTRCGANRVCDAIRATRLQTEELSST